MEGKSAGVAEAPKQAEETERDWSWVEPCAWTPRMLAALENGVRGGKWFSLIDKIYAPKNLEAAFRKVRKNKGAAGVDHISVEEFERKLSENLKHVSEELQQGRYRPQAIRRTYIDKPGGQDKRPLGIPTIRDRTVQGALRQVIEPIFEKQFAACSYGFRPGRSCKGALDTVNELLEGGHVYVVDADIKSYFDTIPHQKLLSKVEEKIADTRVIELIEQFLTQGVLEGMQEWTPEKGTPQGAVISPLLANIYLNDLDHEMTKASFAMVRYADDLVVICGSPQQAEQALEHLQGWMKRAELTLHPTKTRIVDMSQSDASFDFLGYTFRRTSNGKLIRLPRQKSMNRFKDGIRALTLRTSGENLWAINARLAPKLRGWFNYFKESCSTVFEDVDGWVRMRLRSILRKRSGRSGRARGRDHQRWPNAYFAARGLLSLSAMQRVPCQSTLW